MGIISGLLNVAADAVGEVMGAVSGLSTGAIALSIGTSERMVKAAIDAGCKTVEEIEDWLDDV